MKTASIIIIILYILITVIFFSLYIYYYLQEVNLEKKYAEHFTTTSYMNPQDLINAAHKKANNWLIISCVWLGVGGALMLGLVVHFENKDLTS